MNGNLIEHSFMKNKTPWISVEGVDGAGKSSHIQPLVKLLEDFGFEVVSTREPGGTPLGERLREEILNTPMALQTEVLLAFASRAEHLAQVIRPALQDGHAIVCDRFTDSTYAYQGGGQGYPLDQIKQLEQSVHGDIQPDLTLVFDLPVEESFRRLQLTGKDPDKFESQSKEYFERVRQGYHARLAGEPQRVRLIDSSVSLEAVREQVLDVVGEFLKQWTATPSARTKRSP